MLTIELLKILQYFNISIVRTSLYTGAASLAEGGKMGCRSAEKSSSLKEKKESEISKKNVQ